MHIKCTSDKCSADRQRLLRTRNAESIAVAGDPISYSLCTLVPYSLPCCRACRKKRSATVGPCALTATFQNPPGCSEKENVAASCDFLIPGTPLTVSGELSVGWEYTPRECVQIQDPPTLECTRYETVTDTSSCTGAQATGSCFGRAAYYSITRQVCVERKWITPDPYAGLEAKL